MRATARASLPLSRARRVSSYYNQRRSTNCWWQFARHPGLDLVNESGGLSIDPQPSNYLAQGHCLVSASFRLATYRSNAVHP
jgi:hypothetical protein